MKYKVGDMTLLGEIADKVNIKSGEQSYYVVGRSDGYWFTEAEIDAIVIKPKRDIDHLIELWDGCEADKAFRFMYDNIEWDKRTLYNVMFELFQPYTEPRKYPVLTPEELKAVKWLVEGGYTSVQNYKNENVEASYGTGAMYAAGCDLPIVKCLRNSTWITETPINLKELLEAQEGV